jgi:hypothetical protein
LAWQNDDVLLYHGCTDLSLYPTNPNGIRISTPQHGIDPVIGSPRSDFGLGFYTTSWLNQAKSWANLRAKRLRKGNANAVVLGFAMSRNDLAELEALVFTTEHFDYWSFVRYCRHGMLPHARTGCRQDSYDVVFGPLSISQQEMVIKDSEQISFHTRRAVTKIPAISMVDQGKPFF